MADRWYGTADAKNTMEQELKKGVRHEYPYFVLLCIVCLSVWFCCDLFVNCACVCVIATVGCPMRSHERCAVGVQSEREHLDGDGNEVRNRHVYYFV